MHKFVFAWQRADISEPRDIGSNTFGGMGRYGNNTAFDTETQVSCFLLLPLI